MNAIQVYGLVAPVVMTALMGLFTWRVRRH